MFCAEFLCQLFLTEFCEKIMWRNFVSFFFSVSNCSVEFWCLVSVPGLCVQCVCVFVTIKIKYTNDWRKLHKRSKKNIQTIEDKFTNYWRKLHKRLKNNTQTIKENYTNGCRPIHKRLKKNTQTIEEKYTND